MGRHEGEFIKEIVDQILNHVNNTYLDEAIYPVGLKSRVQEVNSLLSVGSNDVRIIGICSMGGMGKTTIAKAIYNHLFHCFEHKSFLANVKEISKQPNGQVHLQEQLLSDILKRKSIEVSNIDRGINVIKESLRNKRVFMVLDDVDELEQLRILAIRKRDWFGLGSRIIITTRDEHLLKVIEADDIYTLMELTKDESLELFNLHAFRRIHPEENYVELSKDIVHYCKGLPLALEVLGSFLFKRNAPEWKSALEKLRKIPHNKIQEKLRISFDGLKDDEEKRIFLDVACFFVGVEKDYAVTILDGCGFCSEIGLSVLIRRCLLKINIFNKLVMHDLLRDMGRGIVRESSLRYENHSRLWSYDEVLDVLKNNKGTEAIEGLALKLPKLNEEHLSTKAFAEMRNLRLLQLNYVHLTGGYDHFSKELRWVCWHGFPLKFIPNNFHGENLVAIDMRYSNLRQFSKEIKVLGKLKVLNLSHSHYLTKTPNFSYIPNLEKLKLKDCPSLVEVHPSIGGLHRIVSLNLRDCKRLKTLPPSFCMLKTLEILNLSGCSGLELILPKDLGKMEGLTNIKNLSFGAFTGLTSSSLASVFRSWVSPRKGPKSPSLLPGSLLGLTSLTRLMLRGCNLVDETFPKDLTSLSSLQILDLGLNNFHNLPTSLGNLPRLQFLDVTDCTRLQSLPELPANLNILRGINCICLERLPDVSRLQEIEEIYLSNCHKLVKVPGLENMGYTPTIYLKGCNNIDKETLLQARPRVQGDYGWGINLTGSEIPSRFSHQSMGYSSASFRVPLDLGYKETLLDVCVIFLNDKAFFNLECDSLDDTCLDESHFNTWVGHFGYFVFRSWDEVEVTIDSSRFREIKVIKFGVHHYAGSERNVFDDDGRPGNMLHCSPQPMTVNLGSFEVTIHTKRETTPLQIVEPNADLQSSKRQRPIL